MSDFKRSAQAETLLKGARVLWDLDGEPSHTRKGPHYRLTCVIGIAGPVIVQDFGAPNGAEVYAATAGSGLDVAYATIHGSYPGRQEMEQG